MSQVNAGGITFDLACPKGIRLGEQHTRLRGDLTQRIYVYQDNEDREGSPAMLRVLEEIKTFRENLRSEGIEITRHVGHCTDGCTRATPFVGVTNYDRAPHRSKPPLPPTADLAARLRDGDTLEEIGRDYDRSPHTISSRIGNAGYHVGTGEPRPAPGPVTTTGSRMPWWQPWMDDAVCASTDPEAFFPEKGGSTREAKKVCERCPVAAECLDYALAGPERFGIFGGLSERERRALTTTLKETA